MQVSNPQGAIVREAIAEDIASIAALHAESWRRTYRGMFADAFLDGDVIGNRLEVWRDRLDRPRDDQFVAVAVAGGRIGGFVCAYGAAHPEWGSLVDNLHVSADVQRGGLGLALMRETGAWLERRYTNAAVHLWVAEPNHHARLFYERLGAVNAETMRKANPGGGTGSYCRYMWARPELITHACAARAGGR
jgi:ribosomal protein S18 acetylase RimI-like enzyme